MCKISQHVLLLLGHLVTIIHDIKMMMITEEIFLDFMDFHLTMMICFVRWMKHLVI